jgi:hypothetical protein
MYIVIDKSDCYDIRSYKNLKDLTRGFEDNDFNLGQSKIYEVGKEITFEMTVVSKPSIKKAAKKGK